MTIEQRFSELYALTRRYPELLPVARAAVERLSARKEQELREATFKPEAFDGLYKALWDAIVEPEAGQNLSADDARKMAWDGVILDHVIYLWTAGTPWRERVRAALPVAA